MNMNTMQNGAATAGEQDVGSVSERLGSSIMLIALGAVFVFGVGLANTSMAHNAAHDTRHAIGFPCH
ncbi:CbtB domain-containing protein [Microbulbifer sp. S227A]|uniref:CbtB domain-containing protein n=1 Tax=Microbulbifer sp. S227A TaxID=3415131 RepID=UPI003C7AF87A